MLPRISKLGLKLTIAVGAILIIFMTGDLLVSIHNTRNTSLKEIERWSILLAETVRVSMNTLMKEQRMDARFEMFDAIRLEIPGLEKVRVIRSPRVNEIFQKAHEQRDIPIEQEAIDDYRKTINELNGKLRTAKDPLEQQDIRAEIASAKEGIASAEKKIQELRVVLSDPRETPDSDQDHQVLSSGKPIFLAEGDTLRVWAPYIARKTCGEASGCHSGVNAGEVLGAVHMQFSLAQINQDMIKDAILAAIGKMVLGLLIIGCLIFMIHIVVIKNVHIIHAALKKFSSGDLSGRIRIPGKDEIQDLAKGINAFIDRFCEMLDEVKQEKRSAQENEERLKVVIDNAGEGIITVDAKGRLSSFNTAAETIFGYTANEAIGRNAAELVTGLPAGQVGEWEITGKRKGGAEFPVEVSVREAHIQGEPQYICILRDITERKEAEKRLNQLANFDTLTGLPNRGLFHDRLSRALVRADRSKTMVALMFLDLDRFKVINDTLGHDAGDRLLQYVGEVLQKVLREGDTVAYAGVEPLSADDTSTISRLGTDGTHVQRDDTTISRLGGDEFTIILEGISKPESIGIVAEKILEGFKKPLVLGDQEIYASTSIGIATYPLDASNKESLIKCADHAMYRAKESGRGSYKFFAREVNEIVDDRLQLEADLRHAIEFEEFTLHYQPKVDIASGQVIGAEALIRWQPPGEDKMVYPAAFIPLLEEIGLIVPLGEWVMRTACAQNREWQKQGIQPLRIGVNLSPRQFRQMNLVGRITEILKGTGMGPQYLELELTENLLMGHIEASEHSEHYIAALDKLSKMGVHIAIDDFGMGYSSLNNLKQFSIHTLKIDESFVQDIVSNPAAAAIIATIVGMGKNFGLNVIAEGVETQEQLDALRALGCHQAQGSLLGEPMSANSFAEYVLRKAAQQPVPT